jgi:hypothetical protein
LLERLRLAAVGNDLVLVLHDAGLERDDGVGDLEGRGRDEPRVRARRIDQCEAISCRVVQHEGAGDAVLAEDGRKVRPFLRTGGEQTAALHDRGCGADRKTEHNPPRHRAVRSSNSHPSPLPDNERASCSHKRSFVRSVIGKFAAHALGPRRAHRAKLILS